MTRAYLHREAFAAMGTSCELAVAAAPADRAPARAALAAGRREVAECNRDLTRFDASSDLSRLNAASGTWVTVGRRLLGALRAALWAREETGGRFDPTVLPALVAAGYDTSFELLEPRAPRRPDGWRAGAAIDVDEERGRARIERGAAVDLGGIGKGLSAEWVLDAMCAAWPELTGGLADLGGDIAVTGTPPGRLAWGVAVADARTPGRTLGTLQIRSAGVATSGRDRRRFGPGGALHHLIDPRTGLPADAGPLAVTVVAPDAMQAEAHATPLAMMALDEAREYVRLREGLSAIYVPPDGRAAALGDVPLARTFVLPSAA